MCTADAHPTRRSLTGRPEPRQRGLSQAGCVALCTRGRDARMERGAPGAGQSSDWTPAGHCESRGVEMSKVTDAWAAQREEAWAFCGGTCTPTQASGP